MKKYIAFDIDELNMGLIICRGEVMRYEDMAKEQPDKKIVCEIYKSKWKGKVESIEEILKFGKKIKIKKMNKKIEQLLSGVTIISKEAGNSMTPLLQSRQAVELTPCTWENVEVGDIVYCRIGRNCVTHLVKAKDEKRGVQIGNNHGHINGWTKQVYGKATAKEINGEMIKIK